VITVEVGDRPLPMISILLINCRYRSWLQQRSAAEVHGRYGRSFESDWTDERSPELPGRNYERDQEPVGGSLRRARWSCRSRLPCIAERCRRLHQVFAWSGSCDQCWR
jgi:hypothetical protein